MALLVQAYDIIRTTDAAKLLGLSPADALKCRKVTVRLNANDRINWNLLADCTSVGWQHTAATDMLRPAVSQVELKYYLSE